jgi:hypothetical protein
MIREIDSVASANLSASGFIVARRRNMATIAQYVAE